MTEQNALVLINGQMKELPNGDTLKGSSNSGILEIARGFRVDLTTDVTIVATFADIIYDNVIFDTENAYDTLTGIYTVPAELDGKLMFFSSCSRMDTADTYACHLSYFNSSDVKLHSAQQGSGGDRQTSLDIGVIKVNTGDYILSQINTSDTTNILKSHVATHFSGFVVANSNATALGILSYDVRFGFRDTPETDEVLDTLPMTRKMKFDADFSGSVGVIGTNPTASFVVSVKDDGVEFGTITIGTDGSVTFATTGNLAHEVEAGSIITIVAPTTVDTTAENLTVTLKGELV